MQSHFYPAHRDDRSNLLGCEERIRKSFFCLSPSRRSIITRLNTLTCDYMSTFSEGLRSCTEECFCRSFFLCKSLPIWLHIEAFSSKLLCELISTEWSLRIHDDRHKYKIRCRIEWCSTSDRSDRTWSSRSCS